MIGYNAGTMANGFLKEEEQEYRRSYRFSLWWVNHREQIKGLAYALFIALDAGFLCFAIWTLADSFLISNSRERLAVAEMAAYGQSDLNAQTLAHAAQPLQPGDALVLAGQGTVADAYAPLTNPNADWWATFDYAFQSDAGTATKPQHGFILPGEKEKPLLALATPDLGGAHAATLVLSNTVWHRVDAHVTGDYATWSASHLAFAITNPAFVTNVPFAGKTVGQTTFTVTNDSSYSYYNPAFDVLLMRGSSVVGVNRTVLESLDSGATQQVAIDWFGALPAAGSVSVVPDVNIFDPAVYKMLPDGTTIDTRLEAPGP